MGSFISSHENSHDHSNGIVFLLGAIFNILANSDFSNLLDYSLKALIGGLVWLLYKLIANYIISQSKSKSSGKKTKINKNMPLIPGDIVLSSGVPGFVNEWRLSQAVIITTQFLHDINASRLKLTAKVRVLSDNGTMLQCE